MIRDQMTYDVVLAHELGAYKPQRDVADMDRDTTIKDIADGQFKGLAQVLELNPVEGICRDVTEDFARDVADLWAMSEEPLSCWQREFLEVHLSVSFANQFAQAAE